MGRQIDAHQRRRADTIWAGRTINPGRPTRVHHSRASAGAILGLVAASVLFGCVTLPERIERHVDLGEYEEARRLLDDADLAAKQRGESSQSVQSARDLFTAHIENRYLAEAHEFSNRGEFDASCERIRAGMELAPWSGRLTRLHEDCEARIDRLDALSSRWPASPLTSKDARLAIRHLQDLGTDIKHRPQLVRVLAAATDLVLDGWVQRWAESRAIESAAQETLFWADVDLLGLATLKDDLCVKAAVGLSLAFSGKESDPPIELSHHARTVGGGAACLTSTPRALGPKARKLRDSSATWVRRWFQEGLPEIANRESPTFETISSYERLLRDHPSSATSPLQCAVGSLHLQRAEARAGSGSAAALSLLHLTRADQLCPELYPDRVSRAWQTAVASIVTSGTIEAELAIDADPNVDPRAYDMARAALMAYLRNKSQGLLSWRFLPPTMRSSGAQITLRSVEVRIPDPSQLTQISSTYYSHSDQVPNPRKRELEQRLRSQKYNVDLAETAMDSAVMIYNIRPSDYGLYAVNEAKRNYSSQVDRYNELVRIYNATSDRITQPVYLPYTFAEGRIEYGWSLSLSYELGGARGSTQSRSIETDYVRVGTRYNDREPSRRRDLDPSFEVSTERTLGHLFTVVREVADNLSLAFGELVQFRFAAGLSAAELRTARWLYHPFGNSEQLAEAMKIERWVVAAARELELPEVDFKPPATLLVAPRERPPLPMTPAGIARWYKGLVGEVLAEGPSGLSVSSGSVVSDDGLVLTCAHGLEGSRLSIRFTAGEWAGTYPAEVVFINERTDTALLRAKGLRTSRWLEVRLDAPTHKGEEVVAIGNPSLPDGSFSVEAISQGIVSHPESEFYGLPRLVADVAIASGSSGGPLIGLSDGKIVGVTVAVARPEFDASRSSSKSLSLAAPANRLGEWLGLGNHKTKVRPGGGQP